MNCSATPRIASALLLLVSSAAWSMPRFSSAIRWQAKASAPQSETPKNKRSHDGTDKKMSASQASVSLPPVQPPVVTLQHGMLTVTAHNSDLSQILREVAESGGMTIDGGIQSVKVFGQYGPASSRDVLTDLLKGLGYNFVMVGETNQGAPKELLLTPQSGTVAPPAPTNAANAHPQALNSDGSVVDEHNLGPGAVIDVPPPPSDDPQERVQQHLQRLEQMHEPPNMPTSPQ